MESIPVTILGGSDRKPGVLPPSGVGLHPLSSVKGVSIRIEGRPLVAHLVERVTAAEGFGPISIAGPAEVYEPLGLDARIVDTDGSVAANLRAGIEASERTSDGFLAILACDVLPSAEELSSLRTRFEEARSCSLWFPFVRLPEDPSELGAFAWKPVYRLVPSGGSEAVRILPGHLGIFDPDMLRLPLLYKLLDGAYRTRNRSIATRRAVILRMVLLSLLAQDLKLLASLRLPSRTLTVLSSGLRLAGRLRVGSIEQAELEKLIGRIFLRTQVSAGREIRYPIVDVISLAEDIDTEEEATQLVREIEAASGE